MWFVFQKVVAILAALVQAAPQNKGKYTHDPAGDTNRPYKHDTNINILKSKFNWAKKKIDDPWHKFYYTNSGDKAQPYKHDTAGDVAEPYKHDPKANYVHDPSGESDNIIIYSLAPNTAPGDTAKPYEKDSNGWWSLMKEENLNNLLSSAAFVSNCYNQK